LIDPDGLYVFDKSVDPDQRKQFNDGLAQARANLQQIAKTYGTKSDEYKKAERALNAYGAEGVQNGVTIFAKAGLGGGDTQVEGVAGKKTADNPTGQNIRIGFDPATFKHEGFGDLIGHEGSHAAAGSDWVKSGFADSANPTVYQNEFDGHLVQSVLAQARLPDNYLYIPLPAAFIRGKNPYLPERVRIWDSGWKEADRATIRRANIDNVLVRPTNAGGLYGETPASTKKSFTKGGRF
jgi:hypothetical protein